MTTPIDLLVSAIDEHRPVVLILGQNALADSEETDGILIKALNYLGVDTQQQNGWAGIFDSEEVPDEFYVWLAERFRQQVHPQSLECVIDLPWSALFTSAVDPTLPQLMAGRGREPVPILTSDEMHQSVRSKGRPPLYYLFSSAGEHDRSAAPPSNRIEVNNRRFLHAYPMLMRALETATRLGVIAVEGFSAGDDWLRVEDLLMALGSAGLEQVLWFGGKPRIDGNVSRDFDEAVESKRILVEPRKLSTVVAELNVSGRMPDDLEYTTEDVGAISIQVDGHAVRIETEPEQRLQVEAVASIIDDTWTPQSLQHLGEDAKYSAFRRFHGAIAGGRLLVEGIRYGFAIQRDYEHELLRRVSRAIDNHSRRNTPVMLEGQSGTGKSVALARIVVEIRERKLAPVLYSIGRIPQPHEVSTFCELADKAGAKATLIVCDANSALEQYQELVIGLQSRGRRVVVLGTQYRTEQSKEYSYGIIAPSELSGGERTNLAELLQSYAGDSHDPDLRIDNNFLALLYRALPASRIRIGTGLSTEASITEGTLRQRGRQTRQVNPISELHRQLLQHPAVIEILDADSPLFGDWQTDIIDGAGDAAGRLIDYVMVAGSLDCPVPINLLLRAITASLNDIDHVQVAELFRDLDLFRWETGDTRGNDDLWVRPRLTLEADLICRRRVGGFDAQAVRLLELIGSVREGMDKESEVRFVLGLLREIGSDGRKGLGYRNSYIDIARTLTDLRTRYGVLDARLMLQESNIRRDAIKTNDSNELEDDTQLKLLEEARDAVQTALDRIANDTIRAARRTKQSLMVERSAIYGFLARHRAVRGHSPQEIWSSYEAAREAIRQAVSAADNYYPHDVGLWAPGDLFEYAADLPDVLKAELKADIYSAFDQAESLSLTPTQSERFHSRRMELGAKLGDSQLSEDAYAELERRGSTAGYFLRARNYAPELDRDVEKITSQEDLASAKLAADYLVERFENIRGDQRCLSLLLECQWISEMGCHPLRGDRQPLPTGDKRLRMLEIVRGLNQVAGQAAPYSTRYLEAVLTWLSEDYHSADDIFRSLSVDTDLEFRGRVNKRHLISNPDGSTRIFQGRIETRRGGGNEGIRIEELNRRVAIRSSDFPHQEIVYGRTIGGFAVAFNFIGPIADPIIRR